MKKYKVGIEIKIEEVEILRETNHMVFYHNSRGREVADKKRTRTTNYFDTWQQAKIFLISSLEVKKAAAESCVLELNAKIEKAKLLISGDE